MPTANNEVNGSLQDKSQALDGPLERIALAVLSFLYRALTVPTYSTPQGVTVLRCLRLTTAGTIETSPSGSAFTCGWRRRRINTDLFCRLISFL